jgi:hypothetical protein
MALGIVTVQLHAVGLEYPTPNIRPVRLDPQIPPTVIIGMIPTMISCSNTLTMAHRSIGWTYRVWDRLATYYPLPVAHCKATLWLASTTCTALAPVMDI